MSKKKASPKTSSKGKAARGAVIRVASVLNPKTEREILARVREDGTIVGEDEQKKLGVKKVKSWVEVETSIRSEASAAFRAGKGKKVSA